MRVLRNWSVEYFILGRTLMKFRIKKTILMSIAMILVLSQFAACTRKATSLKALLASEDHIAGKAGVCVPYAALADEERMKLVAREYNSITCENEMKPESILGTNPNLSSETDDYGDRIPVLDFTRADAILDWVLDYNKAHPGDKFSVRGHVLVWHSQTPTWFFREGYIASGDYVSKEQMLYRLEWYIKSVMEHFDGEDSPYKGLIYAWDVVNEQIEPNDYNRDTNTGSLRLYHNGQPTDWYQVFGGDTSYITQAFVFANKYAPESVKLFYNDYNDSDVGKAHYICSLIEEIKATSGARIDGMGMQGHYGIDWNYAIQIEKAIRIYSEVVDEIQVTELDLQASSGFTHYMPDEEYQKQATWYGTLFSMYARLDHEEGIDITAITFWGTHDSASWLNDASNVGGGANGRDQAPLLFDDEMQPKPAYYRVLGIEEE